MFKTDKTNFLRYIGLARKAGKVILGSDNIYEKMHTKNACAVFVSKNASDNTKKKLTNRALHTNTDLFIVDIDSEEMGKAVGKELTSCIGITDENFKTLITKTIHSLA